jgi:uncharacterized membrane protein YbhN (UPF0104 family)/tRNA A-37 threonylcarbamoyl transferase component Bud32
MTQQDAQDTHVGLMTAIAPRRWGPVVFGVVSELEIRRRPGDVVRVALATALVAVTAIVAGDASAWERSVFNALSDLPTWSRSTADWVYKAGTAGTVVVVVVALLLARRVRIVLRLAMAGGVTWLLAEMLRNVVDSSSVRPAADFGRSGVPTYPVVGLAVAVAALLVVSPFLLRPARRTVLAALIVGATGAVLSITGLPIDVAGSVVLGWGVAAAMNLLFGTPAATPTLHQVSDALFEVGVHVTGLQLARRQVWGEARFVASGPDKEPVSVDVLGRDAADARLFAKFIRSLLYRDSGPSLQVTRPQQLEHRAYVLLLASKAGVPVSEVVVAGIAGAHEDAVLVLRDPRGTPLSEVEPALVTDAVLDDVWANLARLRAARLTHGQLGTANVLLGAGGTTAIVDFAHGSALAPPERVARDAVEFLAGSAALVGVERALAAAYRSLGAAQLSELLPLLEPAAMSPEGRRALTNRKKLFADLRAGGAVLAHEEVPKLAELRRVSPGQLVMAAATVLGFYLIINQFAGVDLWATLQNAEARWVVVAAALSPLPQFTGAIAVQGAVAVPLPYVPLVAEQFANNFTGLIGGTVANTALVIRFFQKQGQTVAVAASSGVLNSLAAGIVQIVLVVVGLLLTGSSFDLSTTGGDNSVGRLILIGIVVAGVLAGIAFMVPRLRRAVRGIVAPQLQSAKDNLRGVLSTPRKAIALFGGNVASQVIFALVLDASLHAYGYALPLFQLIIINSLASVLGGMAPVPGGMGVIEAGLIGGLTAAGIPNSIAVATTFTARLFTAYLPPIWGWFALRWLRHNDYV